MEIKCSCSGCTATWTLAGSKSANSDELRGAVARAAATGDALKVADAEQYVSIMAPIRAREDGWGFLYNNAPVCPTHNNPRGGFKAYAVECGHPGCRETYLYYRFYRKAETMEEADYLATVRALSDARWSLAADKSPRCPEHSTIARAVVVETTMRDEFSTEQAVTAAGRINVSPDALATVRSMHGKRVRITIEVID
jgi:hypothetical protein